MEELTREDWDFLFGVVLKKTNYEVMAGKLRSGSVFNGNNLEFRNKLLKKLEKNSSYT
jgi:hypothetical protein